MRTRLNLVNPLGGRPVQLVCKTDTITKIFTEDILESKVLENGDTVVLTSVNNNLVWLNQKDNIIEEVFVHSNPLSTYVKPFKHPNDTLVKEFNKIPDYKTSQDKSRKLTEARYSIKASKCTQIKLECSKGLNLAEKFGNELLKLQQSNYGLRVKPKKEKVNAI